MLVKRQNVENNCVATGNSVYFDIFCRSTSSPMLCQQSKQKHTTNNKAHYANAISMSEVRTSCSYHQESQVVELFI